MTNVRNTKHDVLWKGCAETQGALKGRKWKGWQQTKSEPTPTAARCDEKVLVPILGVFSLV